MSKELVDNSSSSISNVENVLPSDDVGGTKHHMVSRDTISSASTRVNCHVVWFRYCELLNLLCDAEFEVERLFGTFVLDELQTPEESLATNIANIWMVSQELFQKLTKILSLDANVLT